MIQPTRSNHKQCAAAWEDLLHALLMHPESDAVDDALDRITSTWWPGIRLAVLHPLRDPRPPQYRQHILEAAESLLMLRGIVPKGHRTRHHLRRQDQGLVIRLHPLGDLL